jgi:signal peptidase
MADNDKNQDVRTLISQFRDSDNWAVALARDLLWIGAVVGGIALVLFLICGTWPAVVTIESQSMVPNMNVGDLVVVVQKDRYGSFETWSDGKTSGRLMYGEYGDVIIYKPNGLSSIHPIIHRAIQYVDEEPVTEIRGIQLLGNYTPPHPGYITWGDNNLRPDQGLNYPGIGIIEPVKDEWVIGKALFAVPLVGYLPLHIIEVTAVIIGIMILHEMYLRSKDAKKGKRPKSGKKQR